ARAPRRGRVLVIDDDQIVLDSVRRMLGSEHTVRGCDGAAQAIALIAGGERYDAILCDVMMPGLTAADFCSAVEKQAHSQAASILLMTAGAFTAEGRAFLERTKYPLVEKPFDSQALRALVNGFVK